MPDPNKPGPAQTLVADTYVMHDHKPDPINIRSTDGIQRMLLANKEAIEKLAAYVDGKRDDVKPAAPAAPATYKTPEPVRQTA